jgi:solute carrier family 10 (sodium/bile acid cotransporter), member 7
VRAGADRPAPRAPVLDAVEGQEPAVAKHRRPTERPVRAGVAALAARLRIDGYILALLGTVALASLLPLRGQPAVAGGYLATVAVGFLFFLYGARISLADAVDGLRQWRLHLLTLAATFVLFPLLGLALRPVATALVGPQLYAGLLFLCCLPSTVQSSIAFTSIARGNVPAAICGASFSNLAGIALTPLLAAAFLATRFAGGASVAGPVESIVGQLLLPFALGQLLRPRIGGFLARHKALLGRVDRGSILLVVYTAFSAGVVSGVWHRVSPGHLGLLLVLDGALLASVLAATRTLARALRFDRADEIVIVFCGSKKSLASGIPMATVLFPAHVTGLLVLPLMLFHQMQLMTCAWLARRYAAGGDATPAVPGPVTRPPSVPAGPAPADPRRLGPFTDHRPRVDHVGHH